MNENDCNFNKYNKCIIIVAGGSGNRMGADIPKQFLPLAGRPILLHTVEKFAAFENMHVILVLPKDHFETWHEICQTYGFNKEVELVEGGKTRYESVKNGVDKAWPYALTGIHDGVRPLVSTDTIRRAFETAALYGGAAPVIPSVDSIRTPTDDGSDSFNVDRSKIMLVQTPQVFGREILNTSYFSQEYSPLFTDDATVVESCGYDVKLCEGNRENIKITTPADLVIAEALYKYMRQ